MKKFLLVSVLVLSILVALAGCGGSNAPTGPAGPTTNLYVAIGINARTIISTDGITWTNDQLNNNGTGNIWESITYGNGKFVAVGADHTFTDGKISTSQDGITWTTPVTITGHPFYGITYGNGTFVAVGDSGQISISTDGSTWSDKSVTGALLYSVTYNNNKFVAVGGDNSTGARTIISANGSTWTNDTSYSTPFINRLFSVVYANNLFVAVGDGGRKMSSPDGITWTSRGSSGSPLRTLAYGNNTFVAMGDNTRVALSSDGMTWNDLATPNALTGKDNLLSIIYGNGKFVAVGSMGHRVTSVDGTTWINDISDSSQTLNAIAYKN